MTKGISVVYVLRRREGIHAPWVDVACYEDVAAARAACRAAALEAADGDEAMVERVDALSAFGRTATSLWVVRGDVSFGYIPLAFHEGERDFRERGR